MVLNKGRYATALIPFSGLTPSACTALAAAIDDAIETLGKWDLPTGINTRLLKAKRRLLKVAARGSYGATPDELYETANAILVAHDFYVISRTLRGDRANPIAEELKVALGGPLCEIETKNKNPFDIQSQFWFGTVLAYSGLHPTVPDSKETRPDFLISLGTLVCGVELKRPKSRGAASRALSSAASQLHKYGKPGVIVLDLAQCIRADDLILHRGSSPSARQLAEERFYPLVDELIEGVNDYSRSDKFKRIVVLAMYARFFNWTPDGKKDSDMGFFFKSTVMPEACVGLVVDESHRIQELIARGFERISGNPVSIKRTWK